MRTFDHSIRRILAAVLAFVMLLSMAGCAVKAPQTEQSQSGTTATQTDRDKNELIAEVLGDTDTSDMDDGELKNLADQLISGLEKDSAAITTDSSVYDENGAMTEPFDQVYPELVENGTVTYDDETLLLKMSNSRGGKISEGMAQAGVAALEAIVPMEEATWYEAKLLEGTDASAAIAALRELSEVLLVEYNYEIQTADIDCYKDFGDGHDFSGNDHHRDQWHMHHCGIPDGYEQMTTSGGSSSVIVAVIDTGVDYDHEDLANNIWINTGEIPDNGIDDDGNGYIDDYYGVDIVSGIGNGDDDNGHGTHVAGIIAAENNDLGVVGIAYNVKIMSVKAAMASGTLNQSDIAKAVLYAYEMGAEVINMSFGGSACSIAVQDALAVAYTRCVLVASAGNDGMPNQATDCYPLPLPNYPAALTYVLGVMSVDENGVESIFTNWDAIAYNGTEYELYAPGENMMSTLPNNSYGQLSGTSMAAPVVSAIAAILRSEFTDRDKYPTKFIYGQLCSTSGYTATCCNPEKHTVCGLVHNLPQIVNLYAALTEMPSPQVNMQDYALFDTADIAEGNNGDGVIDAGETIALGLTLRNRWGMSENTIVTIDTLSGAGIADPYITLVNPEVNYGSVGTYSTQDAGRIYTDELLTGWENPFYIQIADNCPNDYIFTLNVNIRCENALDESDETVYVSKTVQITLTVRNGVILPSIISEDMVLTADNLYIIPNSTIIEEGATVRVEPGTHIQFWSNDPSDPYADTYMAYLKVKGTLLIEGTKDDPVYIYPSDLMSQYAVDIGASGDGYVSITYADITNYQYRMTGGAISYADHCTFRQNYTYVYYRYLDSGTVNLCYWDKAYMYFDEVVNCVFYKMTDWMYANICDTCIFVQCGLSLNGSFSNNVFLDNYYEDLTESWNNKNSSLTVDEVTLPEENFNVLYRQETGTTYIFVPCESVSVSEMEKYISRALGGTYGVIETEEELTWITSNIYDYFGVQMRWDEGSDSYIWHDGTPVGDFLLPVTVADEGCSTFRIGDGKLCYGWAWYQMFEVPGNLLPTSITFDSYVVALDMQAAYQLSPKSAPVQLPLDSFLYESSDETVVTVSKTGLITPVSTGTADVYVYSKDRAVYNYVTVEVKDYVGLDEISFSYENCVLAAGETLSSGLCYMPTNTTRKNAVFTSSDETVATVDAAGNITGVSKGTATITASCEGLSVSMTVEVYIKADTLGLSSSSMSVVLSQGSALLPTVTATEGAELDLVWTSTDTAVAEIVDGKLKFKALGTTSIQVTEKNSGLTASCFVTVRETTPVAVKEMYARWNYHYVLMDDGTLYFWGYSGEVIVVATGVKDFSANQERVFVLKENGVLEVYYCGQSESWILETFTWFEGMDIAGIAYGHSGGNYYFAYTAEGNAYAWGDASEYGHLGLGVTSAVDEPKLVMVEEVVDIVILFESTTFFLTRNGEVYYAGGNECIAVPTLRTGNIVQIYQNSVNINNIQALSADGKWVNIQINDSVYANSVELSQFDSVSISEWVYGAGILDGKAYYFPYYSNDLYEIPGINNAKQVYVAESTVYIVTEDNLIFGYNITSTSYQRFPGSSVKTNKTLIPVWLEDMSWENVILTGSNLTADGVLTSDQLELQFNKGISVSYAEMYAGSEQFVVKTTATGLNTVNVYRTSGFTAGTTYEVVIPAGSLTSVMGATNAEEIRVTFTYQPSGTAGSGEETAEEVVVHQSVLDKSLRKTPTTAIILEKLNTYIEENQYNARFNGNVMLNPLSTDTTVAHWLRLLAGGSDGDKVPLGGNYWGTVNETAIGLQLIDYMDFASYGHFIYAPYLTEAPENTYPFVTSVTILNANGEAVTTVGNETITVRITFNRDMDTSIPLSVRFGSAYPYGDYELEGSYVDARTWEAVYTLNTLIENGNQYWTISNGCSATDDLELQLDQARFCFAIDTSAAQALVMQGNATDTGIQLTWQQDDFDTLMGYNIYRSTSEDGFYQRLNSTVIPADQMEFFDDTVEPGVQYYYNFTVVKTDLTESEPSGKISIMSKDTMAPDIYHSVVARATAGSNLVISATVTDNLSITYVNLYYRIAGESEWRLIRMNSFNSKYSAIIPAEYVTAAGVEYYIEAFDGYSYTYKGTADDPYTVTVQLPVDEDSLGDVNGDGEITNLDALLLLYAINDKYNLTAEEFARADLNGDGELWAAEAMRILQYVAGLVSSVSMV